MQLEALPSRFIAVIAYCAKTMNEELSAMCARADSESEVGSPILHYAKASP